MDEGSRDAVGETSKRKRPAVSALDQQQSEWQCLVTGRTYAVACHLRSVGAGGSDYGCSL